MTDRGSPELGPERLILAAAAAALSVGVIVWSGASLAALAAGERFEGGLPGAIRASLRLPGEWKDPRTAWGRPVDREALPGPVLYWLATLTVAIVVASVAMLVMRTWRASRGRGRVRLGVETRARFATSRDLTPLIVQRPVPSGRFVLGRVHGRLVATEDRRAADSAGRRRRASFRQGDRGSVAVIGPSRSGKTVNVIAGLLDWNGPAVVVSVKRDLIDATRSARDRIGTTRVFDPSGVSGLPPAGLARWTPLRAAASPRGAQKAAVALAASIPRSGVDGGADYWVKQAEILLTGLLGAAAVDRDCTMLDVAHWVFTKDIPVKKEPNVILDILREAKENGTVSEREAAAAAMLQLDAVWNLDERVRSSVYATVQTVVQAWLDPAVDASASLGEPEEQDYVDLDWLIDPKQSNTLYLVAPLDDQKRLAPVLGGLLGDLKDQAYQRDIAGAGLDRPLLMVIDEAGNMPLAWLPEVAATCAGIGILLVTIWQSKAQLDAAYGRLSDSVLTNHLTKVVFAGCSDPATLDYVSRLLGDEDVEHRSLSYDIAGGSGRRSVSESVHREPLTPFHLLRQVRPGEAVLIHGTLPPAHLQARHYWMEPDLVKLTRTDREVS
jgi:type IV secretion system protein VirD4